MSAGTANVVATILGGVALVALIAAFLGIRRVNRQLDPDDDDFRGDQWPRRPGRIPSSRSPRS